MSILMNQAEYIPTGNLCNRLLHKFHEARSLCYWTVFQTSEKGGDYLKRLCTASQLRTHCVRNWMKCPVNMATSLLVT